MLLRLNSGAVECPASRLKAFLPAGLKSPAAKFKVKTNASRFFNGRVLLNRKGPVLKTGALIARARASRVPSAKDAQLQCNSVNTIE